jgi:hypothetical protein
VISRPGSLILYASAIYPKKKLGVIFFLKKVRLRGFFFESH